MTIKKYLISLVVIIFLFIIVATTSVFKLAQSSRFQQINTLHLEHVLQLRELLIANPDSMPELWQLRRVINNIRDQPVECLKMIGPIDALLMKMIGTESAISLCQDDIRVADDLLAQLILFENNQLSESLMKRDLSLCYGHFRANTASFVDPIEKTTRFITLTTTVGIVVLSIILLIIVIAIARAITSVVSKMASTTIALEQSEANNKILAYRDTLTQLPNRNVLNDIIKMAISRARLKNTEFAVLFIDLDHFKDVNDSRGHSTGDKLLIKMANRISEIMRNCDSVIRFGGDEFIAIIDLVESEEELHSIAQRIIRTISKPMILDDSEIQLTASIGIATYPQMAEDEETLLKYADIAMYQAKNSGKNQYFIYEKELGRKQLRRLSYENQLRHAINKNQLSLVYQPIVDLQNNKTIGTEALLRWINDEGVSVSPEEFIPIIENSGSIVEIGEWVLQQALEQNKKWQENGARDLRIAINVSGIQLLHSNFPKLLQDTLSKLCLSANCVDIEITESLTINKDEKFLHALHQLSELGVSLLMDDFGTGYSCLSYLHQLPFDILKIDKSFLIEHDSIASTIIAMGKALNMKVIAEGVETKECLDFLKNQRCHYAQGFYFQRPIAANQLDVHKIYS